MSKFHTDSFMGSTERRDSSGRFSNNSDRTTESTAPMSSNGSDLQHRKRTNNDNDIPPPSIHNDPSHNNDNNDNDNIPRAVTLSGVLERQEQQQQQQQYIPSNIPSDSHLSLSDCFDSYNGDPAHASGMNSPSATASSTPPNKPQFSKKQIAATNNQTPPSSLNGTPTLSFVEPPPTHTAASLLDDTTIPQQLPPSSIASSSEASSPALGNTNKSWKLYSAIGSLEDSKYGSFQQKQLQQIQPPKHAFGATTTALLAPLTTTTTNTKTRTRTTNQHATAKPISLLRSSQSERPAERRVQIQTPPVLSKDASAKRIKPKKGSLKSELEKNGANTKSQRKKKSSQQPKPSNELFRPSSDAYTPRIHKSTVYKTPELRKPVVHSDNMGTLSKPNYSDALRRVAMILHQHVLKIERRFENKHYTQDGIFDVSMKHTLSEGLYLTHRYKCTMVRVPMARTSMVCCNRKIPPNYSVPTENEIYQFAHSLFQKVMLSSECSIVCLIYVERLMQRSKVPLLSTNWRPVFMCGLLLASKVWQDLSSWNIEFASVYPQYRLEDINKMEVEFLKLIQWDLYISGIDYAKYFFALRSLSGKRDFRQRYNTLVGVGSGRAESSQARMIQEGSTRVKQEAIAQLSRSCEY